MEDYTTQKLNELLKCLDKYVKILLEIERIMQPINQLEWTDEEEDKCLNCSS